MSSPLDIKRRRLNDSTKTLSKPFVSPFKAAKGERTPLQANHDAANITLYRPSMLAHTVKPAPEHITEGDNASRAASSTIKVTAVRKQPAFPTTAKRADPAEVAAQKALTSLELQIRSIRNDIDTLTQAAQLTSSTTDADLEDLSQKWKLASQSAAEELFGTVKERVCRMGGVAAWKESEKKKYERSQGLGEFQEEPQESGDADCEFDSQGEELPEEEQAYRKKEKRRVRKEAMEAADVEEEKPEPVEAEVKTLVWQDTGGDDDAFTIDMMLRSLNIELDVIGYDKIEQRWVT